MPVVKRLQEISPIPLDVHLMIVNPDTEALRFADFGVASITFHLEVAKDPIGLIGKLRQMGVSPAVSIKPATPVERTFDLLDQLDMVLIMTVEPGFGGQKMIDETLPKIESLRNQIAHDNLEVSVQVDGGVTVENIGRLARLGADTFVAGSAVFSHGMPADNIAALKAAAQTN
jgi:ribulose-phosphate 3-epimerase